MSKGNTVEAEFQGKEVGLTGDIARDHRRIPESGDILEAEKTMGLLKKGYQVLFMSKGNTGKAESQGKEVILMSKGDSGEAEIT